LKANRATRAGTSKWASICRKKRVINQWLVEKYCKKFIVNTELKIMNV